MSRCGCSGGVSTPDEIIDVIGLRGLCAREGLDYDEVRRCIRVALAPGGGITFDGLGRLQASCCDDVDPQPGACVSTVDTLGDFVVGGSYGGAGLIHAYGSPQAIQYGLDHGLDMLVNDVWGTTDEIAVWSVSPPTTALNSYTTSPTSAAGSGVTGSDWLGLHVDAGTTESPTGRGANAPSQHLEPDGGWYGWYAPQYQPQTLSQVLMGLSQRIVTWGDIAVIADNPEFNARSIVAAVRAVNASCAHASSILAVHPTMLDAVGAVVNAGITAGVYVPGNMSADPGEVADAGVTWARVSHAVSDATVAAYQDAGINVVFRSPGRHIWTQRALDLGIRGIHTPDPVYARAPVDLSMFGYYRTGAVTYVRRQTEVGHLTTATDSLQLIERGPYTKSTEYGLFQWVAPGEWQRNAILIGRVCPLPSPTEDSYTWACQVDAPGGPLPSGNGPRIGVNFGQSTDVDSSEAGGPYDGYTVFCRVGTSVTGQLEIGKFTPGGDYEILATSTDAQDVPPNQWLTFRLEVTPTTITFTRTDVASPYSVTATDSDYRGPYVSWRLMTNSDDGSYNGGVRQFRVASLDDPDEAGDSIMVTERLENRVLPRYSPWVGAS